MIGVWKSYILNLWDMPFPHSLIVENFEKSTAVPDMAPEPENSHLHQQANSDAVTNRCHLFLSLLGHTLHPLRHVLKQALYFTNMFMEMWTFTSDNTLTHPHLPLGSCDELECYIKCSSQISSSSRSSSSTG